MRIYLFSFLFLLIQSLNLNAQSNCLECDKIEVVGVYDFFPTPQTPGGDQILLLLTLNDDLESFFNRFYVRISIMSEAGDTITSPTGPNQSLPATTNDTIPYLLQLHPDLGLTNFPTDFTGKIILKMDNVPPCPERTVCEIDYSRNTAGTNPPKIEPTQLLIFPNPTTDELQIRSEKEIASTRLLTSNGRQLMKNFPNSKTCLFSIDHLPTGLYLLSVTLESGELLSRWIQKIE